MTRRTFSRSHDRAAERRGILAMAAVRAIAEAEHHRDRARDSLQALHRQVALDRASGLNMDEAVAGIAELRASLATAEGRLDDARHVMGLDHGVA